MRLIDADELEWYKAPLAEPIRRPSNDDEVYAFRLGGNDAINTIMGLAPTVDPYKHGFWISVSQTKFEKLLFSQRVFKCSACGNYLDFDGVNMGRGSANFCPNCGARMDRVIEDEVN